MIAMLFLIYLKKAKYNFQYWTCDKIIHKQNQNKAVNLCKFFASKEWVINNLEWIFMMQILVIYTVIHEINFYDQYPK